AGACWRRTRPVDAQRVALANHTAARVDARTEFARLSARAALADAGCVDITRATRPRDVDDVVVEIAIGAVDADGAGLLPILGRHRQVFEGDVHAVGVELRAIDQARHPGRALRVALVVLVHRVLGLGAFLRIADHGKGDQAALVSSILREITRAEHRRRPAHRGEIVRPAIVPGERAKAARTGSFAVTLDAM